MPRTPDAKLEGRIVDAAYRLWSQRGEKALTMRAVAKAASTTTPTLYQRFRDKNDLKHFLEERARQKLFSAIRPSRSALDICRIALEFISDHGNEYRLLTADWGARFARKTPMRSFEQLQKVLAQELGGKAEHHKDLAFQLFALVHGTALLRPSSKEHEKIAISLRDACLRACSALMQSATANGHRAKRKLP